MKREEDMRVEEEALSAHTFTHTHTTLITSRIPSFADTHTLTSSSHAQFTDTHEGEEEAGDEDMGRGEVGRGGEDVHDMAAPILDGAQTTLLQEKAGRASVWKANLADGRLATVKGGGRKEAVG